MVLQNPERGCFRSEQNGHCIQQVTDALSIFAHVFTDKVPALLARKSREPQRMRPDLEAQPEGISAHKLVDPVGGDGIIEVPGAVVTDRTEEGTFGVGVVARLVEIVIEERLGAGMQRNVAHLATFAMNPKVRHSAPRVDIFDLQLAQFLPAEPW